MVRLATCGLLVIATTLPAALAAQQSASLTTERRAYAEWLSTASTSPLAAVALQRLPATGLSVGPDTADIPLPDFAPAIISERNGAVSLTGAGGKSRFLPRGRPTSIPPWTFQVLGTAGRSMIVIYGVPKGAPPGWYAQDQQVTFALPLEAPASRERRRVLTLDGVDVEAELAGYLSVPLGGDPTRLQVMRMPIPGTEETELQVYFRDQTNDHGTYPAGRFVEVTRLASGQYRLDFNRARNPFCAYSSVYPCPVPWSGNSIPAAVAAGEKYLPHPPGS